MIDRVFAALTQDTCEELYEPTAVADLTVGPAEDGDDNEEEEAADPAPKAKARGRKRTAAAAGQSDPQAKKKVEPGAAAKLQQILNTCQGEGEADEGDPDDDDEGNELDDTA